MMDDFRPRLSALTALGFMLLVAGGSFWMLQKSSETNENAATRLKTTEPDYTIDKFRYTSTGERGRPEYQVEGERLIHYPDQDHITVQQLRVTAFSPHRPPMKIRSDSAKINSDRTELHLYDNVILQRPSADNASELVATSDYMLILTEQDIVKTDRLVEAKEGRTVLKGTGMTADSSKQTLALHSQVSARYMAPEQVKR